MRDARRTLACGRTATEADDRRTALAALAILLVIIMLTMGLAPTLLEAARSPATVRFSDRALMVTRKGWDGKVWGANQRISVEEALRVNTINGAYASKEENLKGSLTPGKLADFVVLSEDPHTIDAEKIKDITILRTVVGGNTVYQA